MSREVETRLGLLRNVLRQARFVSRSGVLVDKTFVDRLVDKGNCRTQQFITTILIMRRQSRAQTLDLCAQFAAITSIDLVAFCILSNAFFC